MHPLQNFMRRPCPGAIFVKLMQKSDGMKCGTPASRAPSRRAVCTSTITSRSPLRVETTQAAPAVAFFISATLLRSASTTVAPSERNDANFSEAVL